MPEMDNEEWECPNCGSGDPHNALTFPMRDRWEDEFEVDVTCESVYVTPVDGGHGFAFDHDEFRQVIDLFEDATDDD